MWFYSVIFFLLAAFNGLAYFYGLPKTGYVASLFLLIIIAAFRPSTCCADYYTYIDYYYNIDDLPLTFLEPTYFAITYISKLLFHDYIGVFIIYAILGVSIKGYAIQKLSPYFAASLLIYLGSFFLLHEMTQIRIGVASGLMLLSVPHIQEKRFLKFLIIILIGIAFHYSLIVFLPFYFIDPNAINKKAYILSIIVVSVATFLGVNIITLIQLVNLGFLSDKITAYQQMLESGLFGDISLVNPLLFLRIAILITFILNADALVEKNKYAIILIKIYAFSIFAFIGLSPLPALAGRISQLLGVAEVVLVPYILYILRPKYIAIIFLVLFGLMIMYKNLYYSDLMNGYFN